MVIDPLLTLISVITPQVVIEPLLIDEDYYARVEGTVLSLKGVSGRVFRVIVGTGLACTHKILLLSLWILWLVFI